MHYSNGTGFYVGSGKPSRAFDFYHRSEEWNAIAEKSECFEVIILDWFSCRNEAYDYENSIIKQNHTTLINMLETKKFTGKEGVCIECDSPMTMNSGAQKYCGANCRNKAKYKKEVEALAKSLRVK